jgi:hypothetical protein
MKDNKKRKINSKCSKQLNNIVFGDDFWCDPESTGNKSKNELDYIHQMALKDIINKTKKQQTQWEKIFANYIFNSLLISRIYIYIF